MSEAKELKAISEAANAALDVINAIKDEIKKVIIGQVNMIDKLLRSYFIFLRFLF